MDIDLFRGIAAEARAVGVEEIGLFFLGESFSAPDLLIEACRIAKHELGYPYVFLTSNGALAKPSYVEPLMQAGLDSLKWSVNAADYEQFEQVMGVKARYMDQALDNIESAWWVRQNGGYSTKLYASSIAFDGEQGRRMEDLLAKRVRPYVDEHYLLPLYGMSLRADQMEADTGYRPTLGNSGRIDPASGRPNREHEICWSAFREAHVRVDGNMSLCCFGSDDRFDVGDLCEMGFMQAWNSERMQEVRAAHLRSETEGLKALKGTCCEVCVAYG
jgi:hypothetical protein